MINLGALFGFCVLSIQELLSFAVGRLEKRGGGHLERGDYSGEPVPGKTFCYFLLLL